MKQHKTLNINVKLRLNRKPSQKEQMGLVKFIADMLDSGSAKPTQGLYGLAIHSDQWDTTPSVLRVEHHYVTKRKMGRAW